MRKVIILYGEMGVGKNYQGERLAKSQGFGFLDGDTVLPPHIVERVRRFQPLTLEMVNDFVFKHLVEAIVLHSTEPKGLVVAQALYRRETREALKTRLQALGYEVELWIVWVPFLQNLRQLFSRPRGSRWVLYWLLNKPFFEA
jgi:gluconate kinase